MTSQGRVPRAQRAAATQARRNQCRAAGIFEVTRSSFSFLGKKVKALLAMDDHLLLAVVIPSIDLLR